MLNRLTSWLYTKMSINISIAEFKAGNKNMFNALMRKVIHDVRKSYAKRAN